MDHQYLVGDLPCYLQSIMRRLAMRTGRAA